MVRFHLLIHLPVRERLHRMNQCDSGIKSFGGAANTLSPYLQKLAQMHRRRHMILLHFLLYLQLQYLHSLRLYDFCSAHIDRFSVSFSFVG